MALPVGTWASDRFARRRVIMLVFAGQSAVLAALVVATVADSSLVIVAGLVSVSGVIAAPYRPAHLAMLPLVARSPQELVAANVAGGVVEGAALLAGPVLAAVLLLLGGPPAALVLALTVALLGCVVVAGVHSPSDPSVALRQVSEGPFVALTGGIRVLRADGGLALVVGCFTAQLFVRGVLNVLLVLASFDLLGLGAGGVGWLAAAMGAGAIVGGGRGGGTHRSSPPRRTVRHGTRTVGCSDGDDRAVAQTGARAGRARRDRGRQLGARRVGVHAAATSRRRSCAGACVRCAVHGRHRVRRRRGDHRAVGGGHARSPMVARRGWDAAPARGVAGQARSASDRRRQRAAEPGAAHDDPGGAPAGSVTDDPREARHAKRRLARVGRRGDRAPG